MFYVSIRQKSVIFFSNSNTVRRVQWSAKYLLKVTCVHIDRFKEVRGQTPLSRSVMVNLLGQCVKKSENAYLDSAGVCVSLSHTYVHRTKEKNS